jgi:putative FmdB family regulatory protein
MPIYEYECDAHGYFDEQRPMSLAKSNAPCPSCGTEARRVLSVPHLAQLARSERRARDINEKNAHEPRLVQRGAVQGQAPMPRKVHATHGRPWAIGH